MFTFSLKTKEKKIVICANSLVLSSLLISPVETGKLFVRVCTNSLDI